MEFFHFLSFYLTASTRDKKESISIKQPYRPWHKMKLPPIAVLMSYPTPNYINPHTRGSSLIIVNAVFLGIATIVVLLRLYTRLFVRRWFGLDDVFICCAFVSNYLILYSAHLFSIVSRLQLRSRRETITYLVLIAITDLQCRSQRCCGHWLNRLWLESTHLGHTVGLAVRSENIFPFMHSILPLSNGSSQIHRLSEACILGKDCLRFSFILHSTFSTRFLLSPLGG
jgi:hypothetical protein